MLLCGWISMSAGSVFAVFEQAGSRAVSSWPLNQLTNFRVGIQPFLRRCSPLRLCDFLQQHFVRGCPRRMVRPDTDVGPKRFRAVTTGSPQDVVDELTKHSLLSSERVRDREQL